MLVLQLMHQTIDRFKTMLSSFAQAPWTLQRLCEIVVEPRHQYQLLHKVGSRGWESPADP